MGLFTKNTFIKGMNKDVSNSKRQSETYVDMKNFRLLTDEGESSGALVNIKGTDHLISIPDTYTVWEIKTDKDYFATNPSSVLTVTVTAPSGTATSTPLTVTQFTSTEELYNNISSGISLANVNIYQGANAVILTGLTGNITVTNTGSGFFVTPIVSAQQDLIPIGWTNLRDDIYIFTTKDTNNTPTNSAGQIWKLTYDKVTLGPVLTLIYNNIVNFTTAHPIANPGGVVTRYENSNMQRIYWTDNYNYPRKLNVADPNAFAVTPTNLDLNTIVETSVPTLEEVVTGGGLDTGIYQIFYNLRSLSELETQFSQFSNLIHIVPSLETGSYQDYVGASSGTTTNKAIRFKISDLDPNYEVVQLYYAYRQNYGDIPILKKFEEFFLNGQNEIIATLSGSEPTSDVSLNEVTIRGNKFKCKTLVSKDNYLFAGNIRESASFSINYDTRAYRFNHNRLARLYGSQNNVEATLDGTNLPVSSDWGIDAENDCINPYNDENPNNQLNLLLGGWNNYANGTDYKFKSNGTTIGGEGPNVDYEFILQGTETDVSRNSSTFPYRISNVYSNTYTMTNNTDVNSHQSFLNNNTFNDMKSPYKSGLFRGYFRGELYRFGVVFVDYFGNESAVSWIGDIKMPYPYEQDNNNVQQLMFPLIRTSYSSVVYEVCQLGIKFNFRNLSSINDKVAAIKIVRVKRDDNNKVMLGQSPFFQAKRKTGLNTPLTFAGDAVFPVLGRSFFEEPVGNLNISSNYGVIHPAEHQFIENLTHVPNDQIKIVQGIRKVYFANPTAGNNYWKSYVNIAPIPTAPDKYEVADGLALDTGGSGSFPSDPTVFVDNNVIQGYDEGHNLISNPNKEYKAAKGFFLKLSNPIDLTIGNPNSPLHCSEGNFSFPTTMTNVEHYIVNYMRYRIEQYGGNTFAARGNNEYISCSNYIPISTLPSSISIDTYGGDTFVNVVDLYKFIPKNIAGAVTGPSTLQAVSTTFFFPMESTVNTDLREPGFYNFAPFLTSAPFNPVQENGEDFKYNRVFSVEHDIIKYYPEPFDFEEVLEYDNRVWGSHRKLNGEKIDSWGVFPPEEILDVEGEWGGINNLVSLNGEIFYFQDRAFGQLVINPDVILTGENDVQAHLGTGSLLHAFKNISNKTGSKHQHGMVVSDRAIYFWDGIAKKIMRFSGEQEELSDTKGLNAFFRNEITGDLITHDNPIEKVGITSTYDFRRHEVWMTFHDRYRDPSHTNKYIYKSFTIVFSEALDAFQGFYGHTPSMYINDKYNILSPSPFIDQDIHIHEYGDYCNFYGRGPEDSYITILINPDPDNTKVFTNLEWQTEVYNGTVEVYNEGVTDIRVFNDYQDTGLITNMEADFRKWRAGITRDTITPTANSKIRNPWTKATFRYKNLLNRKLTLHDIKTHYALQTL